MPYNNLVTMVSKHAKTIKIKMTEEGTNDVKPSVKAVYQIIHDNDLRQKLAKVKAACDL